jgi:hypothetical protein
VILFSDTLTSRLQYTAGFIGTELSGEKIILTSDKERFASATEPKINYSAERISDDEFYLQPHSLLFEKNMQPQTIQCVEANGQKVFFKTEGDYPFDIFAAAFYLLSRYEEYLPHRKDEYGRYAHTGSLAHKEGFLHIPLINLWLQDFKAALKKKFPQIQFRQGAFRFLPTYDIDEAFAYKYKNIFRTAGGYLKSAIKGNPEEIGYRMKVRCGNMPDPYDAYSWMHALHEKYALQPRYFFLLASRRSRYDKNISPGHPAFQHLIEEHAARYETGLHPSWQSGDDAATLKEEVLRLGHITGKPVRISRQHYIRFTLPDTYYHLISAGIEEDYSMGYASINGFRASVASPFYWYDLAREQQSNLLIYPFCFMDANSFFEQKYSAQQALEEMRQYREIIKSVNGTMITIWHNTFLGTEKKFTGWREVYEKFIEETTHRSDGDPVNP